MNNFYNNKIKWLDDNFTELSPIDYYRTIFPIGSFQQEGEHNGDYKPNGLLQFRNSNENNNVMHNNIINDDLLTIQDCIDRKGCFCEHEFVTISGCSYVGRNKTNKNARFCHALIFDIDMVDVDQLQNLFNMINVGMLPHPTAICVSGDGVHLTYVLDKPAPLYKNRMEMLNNLKAILSRLLWNAWTSQDPNVQYQGIVQGYRVVGTKTKKGNTARAYLCGGNVSLDYLIAFIDDFDSIAFLKPTKKSRDGKAYDVLSTRLKELKKDDKLSWKLLEELCENELKYTIAEAKEMWPDWYQHRVVEKQKPGHWHCNEALYNWWLNIIKSEAREGIRRKCIRVLAAYAQKCDISEDRFINDAYALVSVFDNLTKDKNNHFLVADVDSVIKEYREKDLTKMSVKGIERMTGIKMHRRKEGTLPQDEHLAKCRRIRDAKYSNGSHWYDNGGRPSKEDVIKNYILLHPHDSVASIARACNCSRPTVYKYI